MQRRAIRYIVCCYVFVILCVWTERNVTCSTVGMVKLRGDSHREECGGKVEIGYKRRLKTARRPCGSFVCISPSGHFHKVSLLSITCPWSTQDVPSLICFQVKSEGPKLVPFFKATCVYFVLWLPTSSPSWFSALIKCLPIFCLWVFLLAHGFSFLGAHASARKILAGLIFSALGDAFLIWQEQGYFVHGEGPIPNPSAYHSGLFLPTV